VAAAAAPLLNLLLALGIGNVCKIFCLLATTKVRVDIVALLRAC
jgi:hypothetical protein